MGTNVFSCRVVVSPLSTVPDVRRGIYWRNTVSSITGSRGVHSGPEDPSRPPLQPRPPLPGTTPQKEFTPALLPSGPSSSMSTGPGNKEGVPRRVAVDPVDPETRTSSTLSRPRSTRLPVRDSLWVDPVHLHYTPVGVRLSGQSQPRFISPPFPRRRTDLSRPPGSRGRRATRPLSRPVGDGLRQVSDSPHTAGGGLRRRLPVNTRIPSSQGLSSIISDTSIKGVLSAVHYLGPSLGPEKNKKGRRRRKINK